MKRFKKLLRMMACITLLLCALTVTAFADGVDDELSNYAGTLAKEYGLTKGSRIEKGSGSGNYQLGSSSASAGRGLYVIELQTIVGYERVAGPGDICHMDCALFYQGTDNKVYWTKYFNFNDYAEDFLDNQSALEDNQTDALSIQLPSNCKAILAFYFHKAGGLFQGPNAWSAEWLRIAKVDGSISDSIGEDNGYRYRSYSGTFMAGLANLNQLNYEGWGHHLWYLNQPSDPNNNSCAKSIYVIEMVAGADGYPNREGRVQLDYTDSLGITYTKSITFAQGYNALFPGGDLDDAHKEGNWGVKLSNDWMKLSDRQTTGLASGYIGNYYTYDKITDTCLLPYTATSFQIVLPQNISKLNSITVTLDEADKLELQSIRFIELSEIGNDNYWNGSFGLERTNPWKGRVVAQSKGSSHTVNGKSSYTWQGTTNTRGLTTYARGKGPLVDNSGNGVGVTLQFADVYGAGIESLLAADRRSYKDKEAVFKASEQMKKQAGTDAWKAYFNTRIWYKEFMTLEVTYKDTLGATRRVSVPYVTSYILYNLLQNNGKFSGGSWETWFSGYLQQNENAALALRLAEYESMVGVKVTYGSAPYGITSSNADSINVSSDSIALENICVYENVTSANFQSKYDSKSLAFMLHTNKAPAYYWQSGSEQGQTLSVGGTLSATLSGGSLKKGSLPARNTDDKYLIRVKTADIETAGTDNPVTVSIGYTDTAGAKKNTTVYSMPTLVSNFYGAGYKGAPADYQYERHMRRNCVAEFVIEMDDVATVDSVTFAIQGTNEWQVEYVTVYKLKDLQQRWGERSANGDNQAHIYWRRDYDQTDAVKVAHARQSALLYTNSPTKTIYFTTYDEAGNATAPEKDTKEDEYLTSLPSNMTFEDTLKNLGLSVVKYTYQIDVDVADVEDAGSTNYFYFQLMFENGSSAVVLANQQLASDSFRQGNTESFQIKTTQNYGNVVAVRVICDSTSSTSNVFDKLNIENITVTLSSDSGISKSWLVENVGWIDINYVDEGADVGVDGLDNFASQTTTNAEVVKEFAITRTATAVDLLFCVATSANSAKDSANPYENALGGKFEGTLVYLDGDGVEQSKNFDLTAAIQEYNDTNKTFWLYRPNHVDRFRMSMTDISSVISLIITRTDGRTDTKWVVDSVTIQQIGGLGEVYLSPELTEYYRDTVSATNLAESTNESGITYSISGNGNAMISFSENRIDVVSKEEEDSWSATISRVPVSTSETLNIALYPGSVIGSQYVFTTASPPVRSTVKYTTNYGGALVQNAFVLGNLGTLDGQPVLYGKNLSVSAMSSLNSMTLSTTSPSGRQPVIGKAVVQRVRGNVIMGTYHFDYGNFDLSVGNPSYAPNTNQTVPDAHQILTLQPSEGQGHVLTAETADVAVALLYTSTLDPASDKTVYQTPYIYLTDAGYAAIRPGQQIQLTYDTAYVDRVVGLSLVSTGGAVVEFDNAVVDLYSGAKDAADAMLTNNAYFAQPFTATSLVAEVEATGEPVVSALFRFTTASEDVAVGAGTSGKTGMTVQYLDSSGQPRDMQIDNVSRYFTDNGQPVAGSTVTLPLLISDLNQLTGVVLQTEDSWFLTKASVELTTPDGVFTTSTSVNNWVRSGNTLEIDLSPTAAGNYVKTFTVTGRGQSAGISSSASAREILTENQTEILSETLMVTAYPRDKVDLTPAVTAVGNPDTTWTWNPGMFEDALTIRSDNTAVFTVPAGLTVGDSCTFSVTCNGNTSLTIPITITVEEPSEAPPAEPETEPENDSAGTEAAT